MGNQSRIPVKDADFNNYINIAIPYLSTNKTRLALTTASQANVTSVSALLITAATGWNSVYPQSQNPATATSSIIAGKTTIRTQIEILIRAIFADIPKSVLTQVDRRYLKYRSSCRNAYCSNQTNFVAIVNDFGTKSFIGNYQHYRCCAFANLNQCSRCCIY
jgi:hypothetical protein